MQKIAKSFWFTLAALFLFEAWLWDRLSEIGRSVAALVPFEAVKEALVRGLNTLPAPVVLAVLLIPVAVIEPLKLVALWLLANHHFFLGILAFVVLKVVGLGLIAFLFDVTRDKLLSMRWFAKVYVWVLWARDWAHALVEPYKQRLRASIAPIKAKLAAFMGELRRQGSFGRKLALIRARVRRARHI